MSTLREAAQAVVDRWASDESVQFVSRSDGQRTTATVSKNALLLLAECAMRAELAKPDARPAPAEPQPTEAEKDAAFLGRLRDRSESWQAYSATAPQPAGGEREAFEAWCSKRGQDYERLGDGYTNDLVQRTWQGWQARADLSQPAAQAAEVEALRAQRDIAIDMLAHWCEAVDTNGTGWDDWDEHYKDAAYRPTPIRELINAARAALKEQTPNVRANRPDTAAQE